MKPSCTQCETAELWFSCVGLNINSAQRANSTVRAQALAATRQQWEDSSPVGGRGTRPCGTTVLSSGGSGNLLLPLHME